MALHLTIFLISMATAMAMFSSRSNAEGPPSPGYEPSWSVGSTGFDHLFANLWSPEHQTLDQDTGTLTIWLDRDTGSGFRSIRSYSSGYFGAAIKLHPGYTAGVITCLYLSNNEEHPGNHDEVDIEFLGTTEDKPYVLQTNVYNRGSGDGDNVVGREVQFNLWFDPTQDFHNYAIIWNEHDIVFLVDDVPIRWYPRKNDEGFPMRPMRVYASIWDASSWATEHGKYKADYSHQPFFGRYKNFKISGCEPDAAASCLPISASPSGSSGLSPSQKVSLEWVQRNYKLYDYCQDSRRDLSLTPECLD